MNGIELVLSLEKKGLSALREERYEEASVFFEKIIQINPDYENGMAYYNLACALEEIKEIKRAKIAYKKSIDYSPEDLLRLDSYASFLYLYGDVNEAFDAYISLFRKYKAINDDSGVSDCSKALYFLGKKMGWDNKKIRSILYDD